MPIRQDLILRMIEKLGEAFQRITQGSAEDEPERAIFEIEQALAETFRTRRELLFLQPPTDLDDEDPRLLAHVGRLYTLHADLAAELGRPTVDEALGRAATSYEQALVLRADSVEGFDLGESVLAFVRRPDVARLIGRARLAAMWRDLFEYERRNQRYARAEDALFSALGLAEGAERDELVRRGLRFYDALDQMPDDQIAAGGLTRAEVDEAREELQGLGGRG